MSNPPLVLASTSKYRAALLRQLAIPFDVLASEIDEQPLEGEPPYQTCLRLAIAKAQHTVRKMSHRALIIGSDQVLDLDGEAISKPGSFERALDHLKQAQGKTLMCYTALAVIDHPHGHTWSSVVPTEIEYRQLPEEDLIAYLKAESPYDCAGAVKVETRGITLLKRVTSDDPTALIGLPLIKLTEFLTSAGYRFS